MDESAVKGSQGVVYYAVGQRFVEEAELSARRLKAHIPELLSAIYCNETVSESLFDLHFEVDRDMSVKQLKPQVLCRSPFEKTLFLDTDTYIADSVWEIFDMLERFDLAAAVTPYWWVNLGQPRGETFDHGIPISFPKLNSGVIAYRKTPDTERLFADWEDLHVKWGGGQDQPSFRATIYGSNIRFAVLPPAYNFRLPWPNGIKGGIKIFHGRDPDLPGLCKWLNSTEEWRLIAPKKYRHTAMYYPRLECRTISLKLRKRLLKFFCK